MSPRPRRSSFTQLSTQRSTQLSAAPAGPRRLTARQQQILDWIRGHMEAMGMPPTRAEIAAGLGFSTARSGQDHLRALAKNGALGRTPRPARGPAPKDTPPL